MKPVLEFAQALVNPKLAPSAIRVALIVGTLLFAINHGSALVQGKMTRSRWVSAMLTYLVPYTVNIHGQFTSQKRHNNS
ncbi:MAG: nitrate/nitrite transporter NrtS [Halothece sp.]